MFGQKIASEAVAIPGKRPWTIPEDGEPLVADCLFHLDNSPCLGEFLLDGLGLVLADAFLDGLGSAVHQILGFF